jgi:hypothetical protein
MQARTAEYQAAWMEANYKLWDHPEDFQKDLAILIILAK